MNSYFLQSALLPDGWQHNVRVTIDNGVFKSITPDSKPETGDQQLGVVIPAMPNVHSHVFQRAMAGQSEYRSTLVGGQDSFWTWRKLMYQLANEMDVETLFEVAKNCYQEMKDAGYASVCEFHYIHRDKNNTEDYYSLSECILKAAAEVNMPITLLPVLYAFSGVGDQALMPQQKRFELSVDEYIDLFNHLENKLQAQQKLGICFHSIRAVNQQQMKATIAALPEDVPIHIHIAEQQAEIEQSIKYYGERPVAWLYKHFKVDRRWCLIHATHLDDEEIKLIADSEAVAVICPLTEANLGDGIFPMLDYKNLDGRWAIGSDSNIEINPQQELKMFEYSQRLKYQQRNVCGSQIQPHTATWLWLKAIDGGNQASGFPTAGLTPGSLTAVIVLDPMQTGLCAPSTLDAWIFSDRTPGQSRLL